MEYVSIASDSGQLFPDTYSNCPNHCKRNYNEIATTQ